MQNLDSINQPSDMIAEDRGSIYSEINPAAFGTKVMSPLRELRFPLRNVATFTSLAIVDGHKSTGC